MNDPLSKLQKRTLRSLTRSFDTDAIRKANHYITRIPSKKRTTVNPREYFNQALRETGSIWTYESVKSGAMSNGAIAASVMSLKRSRGVKKVRELEAHRGVGSLAALSLSLSSAASASISGSSDGIFGSDPHVVEYVCSKLVQIFKLHSAVSLSSPTLTPKIGRKTNKGNGAVADGPAEVLTDRGSILILNNDFTNSFARSIARAGSVSSIKRYNIGKVYRSPSQSGCHPREYEEAEFDVVVERPQEDGAIRTIGAVCEAETLSVACQAFISLEELLAVAGSTTWVLRVTNTRILDMILDLCGVPQDDNVRKACAKLFTLLTACGPKKWMQNITEDTFKGAKRLSRQKSAPLSTSHAAFANEKVEELAKLFQFDSEVTSRLMLFFKEAPLPFSHVGLDALDSIVECSKRVATHCLDPGRGTKKRGTKKRLFGGIVDCCECLKKTLLAVEDFTDAPSFGLGQGGGGKDCELSAPAYVCVDLGLRQKQRHLHGGFLFNCVFLEKSVFLANNSGATDELVGGENGGIKFAEGGRFDELVRRHRPPGNFGATLASEYSTAKIPICCGLRFFVGKIVEKAHTKSESEGLEQSLASAVDPNMHHTRVGLGHPLPSNSIIGRTMLPQVMVVGINGLDHDSLYERFMVAKVLWKGGIRADFLGQSGSFNVLHDSSFGDVLNLCVVLQIPILAIVKKKEYKRGKVKLRKIGGDDQGYSVDVDVKNLEELAKDWIGGGGGEKTREADEEKRHEEEKGGSNSSEVRKNMQCFFVGDDGFHLDWSRDFGSGSKVKVDRYVMKTLSTARSKVSASLGKVLKEEVVGVFACDLSVYCLRELGTGLLLFGMSRIDRVVDVFTARFPQKKRVWRNFRAGLREFLQSKSEGIVFLYSTKEEAFDLVNISEEGTTEDADRKNWEDGMRVASEVGMGTGRDNHDRGKWA